MNVNAGSKRTIADRENKMQLAASHYSEERDRADALRRKELIKHRLQPGTLVRVNVAAHCRMLKAPFGCSSVPVIIVNALDEGAKYQVKANGSLIAEPVDRFNLEEITSCPALAREIADSSMGNTLKSARGISLLDYCRKFWMRTAVETRCDCVTGCRGNRCPCRKAGRTCGTKCHPKYYAVHITCKNYK